MTGRLGTDQRFLETLFSVGTACGLSDAQLLERFVACHDETAEAAFESLVLRHGPMVFDISLKILGNTHDAQDAFQATFLILATRARSIMRHGSVASWLHGVALRVARRARSDTARRRAQERRFAELTRREIELGSLENDNNIEVLHDEVERLPRKYREAVVLCYLEGMSLEAAAGQLGCPIGTVGVRLMRARERLRLRLSRRGMAIPAGLLVAGAAGRPASAAVPAALVGTTVHTVMHRTTSGIVPLAAAKLTGDVLKSMVMLRMRTALLGLTAALAAFSVTGAFVVQSNVIKARQPHDGRAKKAPESWIGARVLTKYSAHLINGTQVADRDGVPRLYTVKEINGERVKLVSVTDEVSGWIELNKVILFDRAIDFYTDELAINPKNAGAHYHRGLLWWSSDSNERAIADLTEAIRLDPQKKRFYLDRGKVFQVKKDYDKAIVDYTEATRLDPDWGEPLYLRGDSWHEKGIYDKAIADLTEAIRLGTRNWQVYRGRGAAWLATKEYDKAIGDLDLAVKLNQKDAITYYRRGRAWLEKEQFDKAIADYTEVIKLDPKSASAYRDRGYCRHCQRELDQAIADFTDAINLDPSSAPDYDSRARAWFDKGEYDKAIVDHGAAIKLDPKDAEGYASRGRAWYEKKDYDRAIADLAETIKLNPKNAVSYEHRGRAWHEKGEYDKAIADLDEAIRLDPKRASVHFTRGQAWAGKLDDDAAIADYDEAVRLDPKFGLAFLNRGLAWAHKEDFDRAIADFAETIRLDPGSAWAYHYRGSAWKDKEEYDKARDDLSESIRLDPNDASTYADRGQVWLAKEDYDKAIADFDEAIRLNPGDSVSYSYRGEASLIKREFDKSIADFNEAVRLDPDNPYPYNARAWIWATCPEEKYRDGQKGVDSATKACELTKWNEPDGLETLAAACAETGDFDSAVKWQTKANDLRGDDEDRTIGESRLKLYQEKMPYRDDEPS